MSDQNPHPGNICQHPPPPLGLDTDRCIIWLPAERYIHVQSWPKVLGTLDKVPTGDALFCSGKPLFNFSEPPPLKNSDEIVGLLWMNQHQHCVGVGRGRWTERPCISKSTNCLKTFDQDCSSLCVNLKVHPLVNLLKTSLLNNLNCDEKKHLWRSYCKMTSNNQCWLSCPCHS